MPQQIIISSTPEEVRMGLVNNGILLLLLTSGWIRMHFCIWVIPAI